MIVQCPSCTSRYRIRDANIPPTGGKIRCPSCSHSFIVYPEAEEEEQKTSITGSNEIAHLLGGDDGDGKTEIVQGDALDKMRALEALKNEMGGALDGDGTVEMQNPLDMWKAAQAKARASAPDPEPEPDPVADYGDPTMDGEEEYDTAKTEIVSPDALDFAIPSPSADSGPKKPALPKPSLPKPAAPAPEPSQPWNDPDRTIDAGLDGGTNGEATAALSPDQLSDLGRADGAAPPQFPTGSNPAPPKPGPPSIPPPPSAPKPPVSPPAGPPASPQASAAPQNSPSAPVTQEDSGPNPTTDPFAMPESGAFATESPSAPEVPVGNQANGAFADGGAPVEEAGGPDPRHQGPWKLKTNFGLTYEFPDNKSLRSWMSSREELDGHTLSADGANFYEIHQFPQLNRSPSMVSQQIPSYDQRPPSGGYAAQDAGATVEAQAPNPNPGGFQPSGPSDSGLNAPPPGMQPPSGGGPFQTPTPGFTSPSEFGSGQHNAMGNQQMGSGPAPGFGNAAPPMNQAPMPSHSVRNEYVPPSQASAWDKALWLVLVVLIAAAGVIAIQTFGVFDVVGEARKILGLPEKSDPIVQPVNPNVGADTATGTTTAIEKDTEEQAELAQKLIWDAKRDVKKNKFPAALKKLETVAEIDDSRVEIYELRAEIFEALGQEEDAEAARAKIQELQGAAGDADAGTPDAG